MQADDNSLSDALSETMEITLNGKTYVLDEMDMDDLTSSETFMRNERFNAYLEMTRHINGVNLPEGVRAAAQAAIMNKAVTFDEVLTSISGRCYLLYRSLRHKMPGLQYDAFMRQVDIKTINRLSDIALRLTGIAIDKTEGTPDPLSTTDSTSTIPAT